MKKLVAYLDLLGFRAHLSESSNDALLSLGHYAEIFKILNQDSSVKYTDKHLQNLAREHGVDAFDYFLPFSDSIVIASSKDPNVFIRQLANFLCATFMFNSGSFDLTRMEMEGRENPIEEVEIKFGLGADGHMTTSQDKYRNYPMLFRGGVSYGDMKAIRMPSEVNKVVQVSTILAGQGIVDAVKLEESKIKGPRILFGEEVFRLLSTENRCKFCRKVPEPSHRGCYEILWPNASCSDSNLPGQNFSEIADLYRKAIALWRHYNHEECGIHYFNFSELIVSSAMEWAKACGQRAEMQKQLRKLVDDNGLSAKYNVLSASQEDKS